MEHHGRCLAAKGAAWRRPNFPSMGDVAAVGFSQGDHHQGRRFAGSVGPSSGQGIRPRGCRAKTAGPPRPTRSLAPFQVCERLTDAPAASPGQSLSAQKAILLKRLTTV